jgi:hypothetical protein
MPQRRYLALGGRVTLFSRQYRVNAGIWRLSLADARPKRENYLPITPGAGR